MYRRQNRYNKTWIQLQDQRVYFTVSKCCCQLNSFSFFYLLDDFDFLKLLQNGRLKNMGFLPYKDKEYIFL